MRRFVLWAAMAALLATALVAVPAAAEPPPGYFVDESKLPFGALPGTDTQRLWGVHGGAGFRVEVPAGWNGRLVLWAHGFRGAGLELTVDNHPLRPWLITNGYAWAASSFATNGYDPAQGVKDTHDLALLFNGLVGRPEVTYITGASMGAHVAAASVEQYPDAYDGAMPICGVVGDHELFDFFLDYALVAQALAGVAAEFPPDPVQYRTVTVPAVKAALATDFPAGLNQQGQRLAAVTKLRSGGERPLFNAAFPSWANFLFQAGEGDGTIPRSPGVVVDNTDAVYQFDADPALTPEEAALNQAVLRVAQDPSGRVGNGLANVPVLDGQITVPVLTLHDLGDLFVPFLMEQVYAERVAEEGRAELLVQRAIRGVGHCDFTTNELTSGFTDLVNWVERGVKPAGDDVLDPAVVAGPFYGCAFTSQTRNLGPFTAPCP